MVSCMSTTNPDVFVLRALSRLNRRQKPATPSALALRSGGTAAEAVSALARLARAGLVYSAGEGDPRVTLLGLAVAVASAAPRPQTKPAASAAPVRLVPKKRGQQRAA